MSVIKKTSAAVGVGVLVYCCAPALKPVSAADLSPTEYATRFKVCRALTKAFLNTVDRRRSGYSAKEALDEGRNDLIREGADSPVLLDYVPRLVGIVFLLPEKMLIEPERSRTAMRAFDNCMNIGTKTEGRKKKK